jgi:hypothetical protein
MKTALISYLLTALIGVCMVALLALALSKTMDLFAVISQVFAQIG